MPRTFTPEQVKKFLDNFPRAFFSDAVLGLYVDNTGKKNKFYVMLKHGKVLYGIRTSYYEKVNVSGLNKMIEEASPVLMLRPKDFMPVESIVELFKLDSSKVNKLIFQAVKKSMVKALSYCSSTDDGVAFEATKLPWWGYSDDHSDTVSLPKVKSFEELLVTVDLHAN